MSEVLDPPAKEDEELTIDGEFLKDQATEAVETFFAPLAGILAAASGRRLTLRRRRRAKNRRKAA